MTEVTFDEIREILSHNHFWEGQGPRGEDQLTKREQGQLCGKIVKDLNALIEKEGEEIFTSLMAGSSAEGCEWCGLRSMLVAHNWFARDFRKGKINLIAQWRQKVLPRAVKLTYNAKPKEEKFKDVAKVMKDLASSLPKG
jgi:hypothetical protein